MLMDIPILRATLLLLVIGIVWADEVDKDWSGAMWKQFMGSWDINRAWHGMGSCNKGKSLIIGILGDACIRKRCLFAINGSSSFGSAIELDKLSHSSPDFAQWLGDKSRCYKPKGGQTASPSTEPPLVSFIFTVYNNDAMVAKAILEVFRTAHEVSSAEFVILHDGHTEPMPLTRTLLSNMKELFGTNIKQLKHETAQGYGASNNEALAAATGTYAVLLNSDVQVMPSWLAVLMKTMLSYPGKVGMVGPLQFTRYKKGNSWMVKDGGGVIHQGAKTNSMFNAERLWGIPEHYARIVDYVSAACVLFNRTQFLSYGLFDPQYQPAYYEDTDAAMTFLQHGYVTILQPLAVVLHSEGKTIQLKERKALMARNKERLYQKHKNILDNYCPKRPVKCPQYIERREEHCMLSHYRQPNKILYMDSGTKSSFTRSIQMMTLLQLAGYTVSVLPFTPRNVHYHINLRAVGMRLYWPWEIQELLMFSKLNDYPLNAMAKWACPWKAIFAVEAAFSRNMGLVKEMCPDVPVILDMANASSFISNSYNSNSYNSNSSSSNSSSSSSRSGSGSGSGSIDSVVSFEATIVTSKADADLLHRSVDATHSYGSIVTIPVYEKKNTVWGDHLETVRNAMSTLGATYTDSSLPFVCPYEQTHTCPYIVSSAHMTTLLHGANETSFPNMRGVEQRHNVRVPKLVNGLPYLKTGGVVDAGPNPKKAYTKNAYTKKAYTEKAYTEKAIKRRAKRVKPS